MNESIFPLPPDAREAAAAPYQRWLESQEIRIAALMSGVDLAWEAMSIGERDWAMEVLGRENVATLPKDE